VTSAFDALQSRQKVREIAAKARADERTVRRVLRGEGPRNAAYERVVEAMAAVSTDPPPPPTFVRFGELGEREIEFIEDGRTIGAYVLMDPRDQTVRYVGASEKVSKRLSWHLVDHANAEKWGWIVELRELNLRPVLIVIESSARETAHLVEEKWISAYLEMGTLYNQKDSGYQFRRQRSLSMERFRGTSFASLASDGCFIGDFAKVARVRVAAVRNLLSGQEVWPKTYASIRKAAAEIGVVDLPEPADRAPRGTPNGKRIAELEAACAAKDAELAALRARVAELEAERQASDAALAVALLPAAGLGAEFVEAAQAALEPRTDAEIRGYIEDIEGTRPAPELEPPRPPRPPAHCHVSLECDGVDLLAGESAHHVQH